MREMLYTFIWIAFLIGVGNNLVALFKLRHFWETHPKIDTWKGIEFLRKAVSVQMYSRLFQGGALLVLYLMFGIGMAFQVFSEKDIPVVVSFTVIVLAIGFYKVKIERKVHQVQVAHKLDLDFQHVMNVWDTRALPDWDQKED
jgi:uncharacterized protein Usg